MLSWENYHFSIPYFSALRKTLDCIKRKYIGFSRSAGTTIDFAVTPKKDLINALHLIFLLKIKKTITVAVFFIYSSAIKGFCFVILK